MASNIEQNLEKIQTARFGKDVRQSIHDAIHDCYEDGKAGAVDLVARERIDNLVANNNPTEGNSELLDIRVGADGTVYDSAGEAVRAVYKRSVHSTNKNISSSNYDVANLTDANNAEKNSIYFLNKTLTSSMIANLPVYGNHAVLITFNYSDTNDHGLCQIYVDVEKSNMYFRGEWGANEDYHWSEWKSVGTEEELQYVKNNNYIPSCNIFNKVCCCGDSYTSGHIKNDNDPADVENEEFAWPKYMSKMTGNEYINCGKSGATVLTWMTDSRGYLKAKAAGKVQAYLIGLGLNDRSQVTLGTTSDIGTDDPTTYYGGLAKIVRLLNGISPKAKIFIMTMTKVGGRTADARYNQAIKDVVNTYKNTYPVYVLDLDAYADLYNIKEITEDYVGGHQTAIGYCALAKNLHYIWSDFINSNISEFQDVFEIPYD